jgi:general secretion pathway protein C
MQRIWMLRFITALLWAAAAASAVYWTLRLASPPAGPVARDTGAPAGPGDNATRQQAMARLLGAPNPSAAAPVVLASRFSLAGVVAQGRDGAALLVVDGKPARPFRVGSYIDDNTMLKSVGPSHAVLSSGPDGPVLQQLELPKPTYGAPTTRPAGQPPTPPQS